MKLQNLSKVGLCLLLLISLSIIITWTIRKSSKVSRMMINYMDKRLVLKYPILYSSNPAKSQSFSLWNSIRLSPGDRKGEHGDPLQLYSDPGTSGSRSWKSIVYLLIPKPNDFINCSAVVLQDQSVSKDVQNKITSKMRERYIKNLIKAKTSCREFAIFAGYITDSLTEFEANFPIAFSIIMYKDVEQFEILLRTIYRPQNVYCIHVDKESPKQLHVDVKTISSCFDNVFVTSYSVKVIYAGFTALEPELICLRELWQHRIKWKYFINLTGQELPLRTNFELVKILTSYDGASNVGSDRPFPERLRRAGPAPHGLTPVKGSVHVTLSRAFVDFILHNKTAQDLFEWTRKVHTPDEIYFSTIYYNKKLQVPGAYKGEGKTPLFARLKLWEPYQCHGKMSGHGMCIFGRKDLPLLASSEKLFVNKLFFGYYPEVMLCIQELLYNRTMEEYEGRLEFNASYYATRNFVKNKF